MVNPEYHKLWITVIEAKDLVAADLNGKSDPYVLIKDTKGIKMTGKGVKTKVIPKTLEPKWNETFEFEFNHNLARLAFIVYDKDNFSTDDKIGKSYVYIEQLWTPTGELDEWFKIEPKGLLHLKFRVQMSYPTVGPGAFVPIPTPQFTVGFGWEFPKKVGGTVDEYTDGSVVALDWNKKEIDHVTYNRLKSEKIPGVLLHRGDNFGGGLKGDDEEIVINTTAVTADQKVMAFAVFVNSYSGQPLSLAKSLYIRIRDSHDKTVALARVSRLPKDTGMLFGFIYFAGNQWWFKYTADVLPGKTYAESLSLAESKIVF